ncbi:MarR family transcriptional regulator [Halobellus sp. Atlit-38R]|uniref:MarR family transcriptional regulator n=1 Tax=Halobellus sp. Atlit-38R TaxID=2282131 RepID=UPI003742A5F8
MLLNKDPVVTAPELADAVGVTQQAAHKKLQGLKERGLVRSKEAGSSAVVWWVTEAGRDAYAESDT